MRYTQMRLLNRSAIEPRLELAHQPWWWWRAIAYLAATGPLVFFVASLWTEPDWNRPAASDWRPVLALADTAWEKADLYEARHLYMRAARLASWREDWDGLLAAACGMKRLDNEVGSYFNTHALLVRAMMVAEVRQSRAGIAAVASAFRAIGEHNAAAMVFARVGTDWPEETLTSPSVAQGCWQATAHNR
jgi:hypothetical protein